MGAKIVEHMTAFPQKRLGTLSNFHLPLKQLWRPKKKKQKKKWRTGWEDRWSAPSFGQ